jgi:hypothetical protein
MLLMIVQNLVTLLVALMDLVLADVQVNANKDLT